MSASTPAADAAASAGEQPAQDVPLLPSRNTGLLMGAVMAVSVMQFLDLTIANVALPNMRAALGATPESISWVVTSYIIAGVLVLPLTGWLSDRIGSRNLFIGASLMFVLSSMLCGAATSLTEMVLFRALQGIASAFIGPMSQTAMFDLNAPSRQARAMSIWGLVVMIGPISGPFIGGFLTDNLNWRWVFFVNVPIGIPALAILWWRMPSRMITRRQLDIFGAAMLALGLVGLQLLLDRGNQNDWFDSTESVVEILVAICAFWIFAVHTRDVAHPLFQGAMVRNRNFIGGLAFMVILGVANVALSSVLPTMYQSVYGYSVMTTGMLMAPRGIGVMVTMAITNRIMRQADVRYLITAGYLLAAGSMWLMTTWSLDMDSHLIVVSAFIQGLGLGFIFVPVNMIAFSTLAPNFRTDGTTLMTLARNLGGSFGISAIVTTLSRNLQISHADIAANVTSYSVPAVDPSLVAGQLGPYGDAAMAMLNGEVTRQAAFIAYLDNFFMLFWVLLSIAPLAFFLKRPRPIGSPMPPDE